MNQAVLREIGKRIQSRRRQQGYTQEQLADLMNVSIQMVSNLERGNKAIRIDNLVKLCRILEISTDYILTGQEYGGDLQALAARFAQLSPQQRDMISMLVEYCLRQTV